MCSDHLSTPRSKSKAEQAICSALLGWSLSAKIHEQGWASHLLSLARLISQRQDPPARLSKPFAQPCSADLSAPRFTGKAEQGWANHLLSLAQPCLADPSMPLSLLATSDISGSTAQPRLVNLLAPICRSWSELVN